MRPRNRQRHKGRRESGGFVAIPHAVMDSANWRQCSPTGIKLLCDLARQYNGRNNGDLCAALSVMTARGWAKSGDTVPMAARELRHYGLVALTRQGGLHGPSLYALTWQPIDECGGKLEMPATVTPPGDWKRPSEPFKRPSKNREASPPSGTDGTAIRCSKPQKPP